MNLVNNRLMSCLKFRWTKCHS